MKCIKELEEGLWIPQLFAKAGIGKAVTWLSNEGWLGFLFSLSYRDWIRGSMGVL